MAQCPFIDDDEWLLAHCQRKDEHCLDSSEHNRQYVRPKSCPAKYRKRIYGPLARIICFQDLTLILLQ